MILESSSTMIELPSGGVEVEVEVRGARGWLLGPAMGMGGGSRWAA